MNTEDIWNITSLIEKEKELALEIYDQVLGGSEPENIGQGKIILRGGYSLYDSGMKQV